MEKVLAIHTAMSNVIARINLAEAPLHKTHGLLQIEDMAGDLLLFVHVGHQHKTAVLTRSSDTLDGRCSKLRERYRGCNLDSLADGTTLSDTRGSDLASLTAGAVYVRELIISFANLQKTNHSLRDEAIVIMSLIQAGILSRKAVRQQRCIPGERKYNAPLDNLSQQFASPN